MEVSVGLLNDMLLLNEALQSQYQEHWIKYIIEEFDALL